MTTHRNPEFGVLLLESGLQWFRIWENERKAMKSDEKSIAMAKHQKSGFRCVIRHKGQDSGESPKHRNPDFGALWDT